MFRTSPSSRDRVVIHWAYPLAQYRAHRSAIDAAISRVLEGGAYILGAEVESFERAFGDYCSVEHAVGVASGTDALILTLRALGVGPGDEVITVSHTAVATVAAVLATGATPVLVDVDPIFYTIDPARVEQALTQRTKAIIAVHLYGQAADMEAITAIVKRRGVRVIEDCAQAAGAGCGNRVVGSLGDIACFSFYPTKNLGAIGDGGMVITADAELAVRLRRLRQYGWDESRVTREAGLNSRLDPLQAAILNAKLPHLDADNERRRTIAGQYQKGLAGLPLAQPAVRARSQHAYHLYVVACDHRDALSKHLSGAQVGCAVHYPVPVHLQKGYAERAILPKDGLPVTTRLAARILTLPLYPELSDESVAYVIASVRGYYKAAN
jgi:dTDP-4-amino-4,6-dideoxygalactose transaminase